MQQTSSLAVADAVFRLPVASDEVFAHSRWRQARAALLAVLARGGAAVLLGPPGTGKTLLLQDLARTLRHEGRSVRLVGRGDALDPALTTDVLLVDEAGYMDADTLEALCVTDTPFVLAALPDFAGRLTGLPRPVTTVALEPLPPQDVARFVAARLLATGQPRDILEPEAVLALARHSGGLLRLVTVLGGAAAFLAELEGSPRVCLRHVDEAAAMRDGMGDDAAPAALADSEAADPTVRVDAAPAERASHPTGEQRRTVLGAAAIILCLALVGVWAFRDRQVVQAPSAQADNDDRQDGNHPARDRRAASTQPSGAPSREGDRAAGMLRNDPGVQPPPSQLDRNPDSPAARSEAADPPQPAATTRRVAKAASPPADTAVEPRQAIRLSDAPVLFRGPILNETMGRSGQVTLQIRKQGAPGLIMARFEASAGLLGSGELAGSLSANGRITVSGQLMMGNNPFICDLSGVIAGDKLTGSANFVRSSNGRAAHSSFALTRS